MDQNEIIAQASKYIELEKNEFFKNQVMQLIHENKIDELNDRFYRDLEFGTGGLRGVVGGGFNRMNSLTVQRATQGLANYLIKTCGTAPLSAVIAHDNRNFSEEFALEAARVFCKNGITTYLFTGMRPTPELSFAIRFLKASTGINITASHNPPEYNGYKAYWSDGCQVLPPHDAAIVAEAKKVTEIKTMTREEAISSGRLNMIDALIDGPFKKMAVSLSIRPELIKSKGKELKVVYTPLHGTGSVMIPGLLDSMGIDCICVPEQMVPDGNFSTVASPNPEESSALHMACELARQRGADIVLATDPDADRLGIAIRHNGQFMLINGNQLGSLLIEYILSGKKEKGTLPSKPAIVKSIVTTELQRKIAQSFGVLCFDVLTGIKYIGQKIEEFERGSEGYDYIAGGEESYGFLIGKELRDKDAVSASLLTAEMALYHKLQGRTLIDQLDKIYEQYGYYEEALINKTFRGETGLSIMKNFMDRLRAKPPQAFAGMPVAAIKDYMTKETVTVETGAKEKNINLPASNVLQFILVDGSIVSVRPSGTEPKIKFYASLCEKPTRMLAESKISVKKRLDTVKNEINNFIGS